MTTCDCYCFRHPDAWTCPCPCATHSPEPRIRAYRDTRDWWIGYYRGPHHHYVCPLPTLVIRWRRRCTPI